MVAYRVKHRFGVRVSAGVNMINGKSLAEIVEPNPAGYAVIHYCVNEDPLDGTHGHLIISDNLGQPVLFDIVEFFQGFGPASNAL